MNDFSAADDLDEALAALDVGVGPLDATVDVLTTPRAASDPALTQTAVTPAPSASPAAGATPAPAAPPADSDASLDRLGRYSVLGKLGEGGMGVVYMARDPNLRRRVAVKHGGSFEHDPEGKQRFVVEAQLTAQLDHPGIVPVYSLEAGADGGVAYAMKVVRGVELAERIEAAKQLLEQQGPEADALRALQREVIGKLVRVCETMHFVHAHGVLHRDLKPENVMLGAHQEVYVMDWGLAKVIGQPEAVDATQTLEALGDDALPDSQTIVGSVKGTPLYMAPEQARSELDRLGPPADVYGIGMILYELLYLQRARVKSTLMEVVEEAMNNTLAPPPPELEVDAELTAILDKALASRQEDRYPSTQALGEDLTRWLRGEETRALPDRGWRRVRRWIKRHPQLALVLLGGTTLAAILLVGGSFAWQRITASRAATAAAQRERAVQTVRARAELGRDRIVRHFLYYGGLSSSLTASTAGVLEHAAPGPSRVFPPEAFTRLEGAPPGTAEAPGYGKRLLSPRAFVGRGAPNADPQQAARDLRLLSHLLEPCRETFLAGIPGRLSHWKARSAAEVDRAILAHEAPLEWVYVALERSGAIALFPGAHNEWPTDFDPRQRPWYREAKQVFEGSGKRRNWSQPYRDLMGQGLVITCTEVVLDPQGGLQGVVALDLSFDDAASRYLRWADLPGFQRATIVYGDGQVFMRVAEPGRARKLRPDGTVDLGRYDDTEVLAAIATKTTDHMTRGETLTLWVRAPFLDWILIVDVDLSAVEAAQ